MAYVTGTANSFPDLLIALQSACIANGYALNGNVLSKGSLFVEVTVVNQTYPALRVHGGKGQSAGVLTGRSDVQAAQMGIATTGTIMGTWAFTFPVNYSVHMLTNPDEVYFIVNLNTNQYQTIAFGQSNVAGLNGSGNWYAGSDIASNRVVSAVDIRSNGGYLQAAYVNGGLFQGLANNVGSMNGAVDHALDTATWGLGNNGGAWLDPWQLLPNTPSAWNGESVLIPVTIYATRPSSFVSCVAELAHARFLMLDNVQDQQIITLGSDRWKVYPWWKRSARFTSGAGNQPATGTYGHAIRYDGP